MNAELEKNMEPVGNVDKENCSPGMWLLKLFGGILAYIGVTVGTALLLSHAFFPGIVFQFFVIPIIISLPLIAILFGQNRKLALWLMFGFPLFTLLLTYGTYFCSTYLHWFYYPSVYRRLWFAICLSGYAYFVGLIILNVTLAIVKVVKKR